ncbi:monofunctional biosynthetic peptidoglycan transglycosylase [Geodermatophilus tzadiensis]|uniref:Monofunctional biosynthetic peptidoglycan transglycosylase n=1 Tax=Geodermatophilus tzadiensis TaxID=1137988 RepID=A0A2T0TX11_9ACTN|nr:biosynthetic peptidoglycan transglycosylase [Geodermatophilus tzadiensis]PRY50207.1 monofunctional biosynthetic peptidoglycan transglycosylase [Geodermatophilus tzadiensis]
MPFAPRRRRPPDDPPPGRRGTDRVPTRPLARPAADADRFPPYGDPAAGPPPPDPWAAPPPRWRPAPPAEPAGPGPASPGRFRRPDPRRREDEVPRPEEPGRGRGRRLRRRAVRVLLAAFVLQALVLVSLRWVDPPTTAFMLANEQGAVQQSVPVEHVSRYFLAAVIAHEDQALPYRSGAFTWDELSGRAEARLRGEEDPSGSTIPQQVAKNLFLNQSMSIWRKAVEAGLAAELAVVLDDRRMLELYVDNAQLGPRVYGICAASWYYFDTPPSTLSVDEAVQLVGLLPSPGHVQRAPGGGLDFDVDDGLGWLSRSHVINAQNRVPRHIEQQGFQPVEDAGITGLAQDQPDTDDDCSERPEEVAELIAEEGTG